MAKLDVGAITEGDRPRGQAEKIWLGYMKVKYPNMVIGSELYDHARHAFFVGLWAMMGLIQKCPDDAMNDLISNFYDEIKAELTRTGDVHIAKKLIT